MSDSIRWVINGRLLAAQPHNPPSSNVQESETDRRSGVRALATTRVERSPGLTIAWREHLDVRYVAVSGEVDVSNAHMLEATLAAEQLHIDMSGTSFIDSTAIRALVRARIGATEFDLIASRQVRRVMEITNVVDLLNASFEDKPDSVGIA